jgi:Subtilase family/Bacterial Ig domain
MPIARTDSPVNTATRRLSVVWLGALALVATVGLPSSTLARDFVRTARLAGRLIVRERAGLSVNALYDALRHSGARRIGAVEPVGAAVVEAAETELASVQSALRRSGLFTSVERDYVAEVAEDPDDVYYAAQWGLMRIGAPAAWGLSSGAGVIVAVIDTGIETSHPDLQGDVLRGYDFVNDDDDPADDHGHGTRMSGIIAAQRNNAAGIAGVAPAATLLPVKVMDWEGHGAYSAVANGIVYAVDQGAKVLNLSLAGPAKSEILQAAVDYATAHDVIVVAAAGNYGANIAAYPAASTGAIAVSAIDSLDGHPSFSNYGAWIDFAAPGVDIITTSGGGGYGSSTGTSPAAAFGSALFALLLSAEPNLTRADAIDRVRDGCADLGTSGWDKYFGAGGLDAYATLVPGQSGGMPSDDTSPEVSILSPAKGSLMSGMVPVDVAADDDTAVARVELFVDDRHYATATTRPYQFVVDAARLAPGQHKLRAYAYDTSDNVSHTKSHKILLTTGVGLLVGHAVAKASKVTISADFALPAGTRFDPSRDSLAITLTSATGMVLAARAPAGSLSGEAGGRMKGIVAPAVPANGSVRLSAKGRGDQPLYSLKIKALRLSGMISLPTLMNLDLQVGSVQLSQSLTFRPRGSALLYP